MLIGRHSFIRQNKLSDVAGRIDYIFNPKRQEHLYVTYQTAGATQEFWKNQPAQKKEQTSEPPTKASVLKKLHSYQQEGRQQPKRTKKKSRDMER